MSLNSRYLQISMGTLPSIWIHIDVIVIDRVAGVRVAVIVFFMELYIV